MHYQREHTPWTPQQVRMKASVSVTTTVSRESDGVLIVVTGRNGLISTTVSRWLCSPPPIDDEVMRQAEAVAASVLEQLVDRRWTIEPPG